MKSIIVSWENIFSNYVDLSREVQVLKWVKVSRIFDDEKIFISDGKSVLEVIPEKFYKKKLFFKVVNSFTAIPLIDKNVFLPSLRRDNFKRLFSLIGEFSVKKIIIFEEIDLKLLEEIKLWLRLSAMRVGRVYVPNVEFGDIVSGDSTVVFSQFGNKNIEDLDFNRVKNLVFGNEVGFSRFQLSDFAKSKTNIVKFSSENFSTSSAVIIALSRMV